MNTLLEILIILILILANGFLAMTEMAVVSARRARLQQRVNEGDKQAQAALELAEDPSDLLSTVQVGITLIGILAGAFGGAALSGPLGAWLAQVPLLAPYSELLGFILVVVAVTYLSLVLGELAPKRLALNNPESIAGRVAGPMKVLSRITSPLVRLLGASTNLVLRLMGVRPSDEPAVTEEEIRVLIEQGTQAGVFESAEQDLVEGVFRLGDRRVGSLMMPRTEIVWLDLEDPVDVNQRKIAESVHSRFPVAYGGMDEVVGVVLAKDLLSRSLAGEPFDLEANMKAPLFVPESTPALKVLELFKESRVQLILVIDEYGGVQGLVTPTDILETIAGSFPVMDALGEPEVVEREDGSWLLGGLLPIDEFCELFGLPSLPNQEKGYFQTLGGFVMDYLGRVPETGSSFEWSGYRFEVMDMDGFRVDKVLLMPIIEEADSEGK